MRYMAVFNWSAHERCWPARTFLGLVEPSRPTGGRPKYFYPGISPRPAPRYPWVRLIDIRARKGQRFQMDAIVDGQMLSASIDVQMIEVGGQQLQVAIKRGPKGRPPLLMFRAARKITTF